MRLSPIARLVAVVALPVLGSGCLYSAPWNTSSGGTSTPSGYAPSPSTSSNVRLVSGSGYLEGDMGEVARFAGTASIQDSSYSVRMDAENTSARWWAMASLSIEGGLGNPALRPGAHFDVAGYGNPDPQIGYVSVTGCSGPRMNDYTYDHSADRTVIDVAQGPTPNDRVLTFTAYFTNTNGDTQTVNGSLAYQIP